MAEENPYESSHESAPPTSRRTWLRIALMIVLLVLMIPATAIAFFIPCTMGFVASQKQKAKQAERAIISGISAGILAGGVMVLLFFGVVILVFRRTVLLPENMQPPHADAHPIDSDDSSPPRNL